MVWNEVLNIFFFVFHTAFTLFNVVGWIFPGTRRLHLITIALTAFSWFILGIWYGWGYCLCTDWHWTIRENMGLDDHSRSYIHFLVYHITGINFNARLIENLTLIIFLLSAVLSIWLNIKDHYKNKLNN